jgi:hypothetical protein
MPLTNLPGVKSKKNDGNLRAQAASRAPRILIVGTAGKGAGDDFYLVPTTGQARGEFGNEGSLLRGMWEAVKGGANEVALYRIGSTAAVLTGVGDSSGAAGYTIETVAQDADAGGDYEMYYTDSTDRLVIRRVVDEVIVFDNLATAPIDNFEVTVSGARASGGGPDIGSSSSWIALENVDPSTYAGTSFVAGTDGLSLSRMEMWEQLYVAYKHLLPEEFDVIIPMDVFLDDYNVVAQGHFLGAVTPVIPAGQQYPTAGAYSLGSDIDSLGKVYVEEYEGKYYFWWDINGDGVADVYPTPAVGSSSSTTKIDGTTLTTADFHEVNFGYQLGRFLYEYTTDIVDCTGVIGVLPPASNSLTDKARWYGKEPTWTYNAGEDYYYIASSGDNGSGLLGNKFMVGRSDHRSGIYGGGFILTDTEFMDGAEQTDDNDIPVDLGKYFSVTAATMFLRNNYFPAGYLGTYAATYGGFYLELPPASAPTNKSVSGASIVYTLTLQTINDLTGYGYVTLRPKRGGVSITDAPTASMPNSDWRRLSTVRIVKTIVDQCRTVLDPYIGEGTGSSARASMDTAVEGILIQAKRDKYLQDFKEFGVLQTPQQEVEGTADLELTLIPAYELRQINITVSLSKTGA